MEEQHPKQQPENQRLRKLPSGCSFEFFFSSICEITNWKEFHKNEKYTIR